MGLANNEIHQGDCIDKLQEVTPASIDLVFADPPFNIGYEYDVYHDKRDAAEYVEWSKQWMQKVFDVLKPEGTFWLAIGDEFAAELKIAAQQIGFHCRSWVIWYYTFGVNCKRGFSRSHTHLFHFIKHPFKFTFNDQNPAVRIPSARQLVYADARANPKGRLPDNTWIIRPQDLPNGFRMDHDTWYFPRVAGTFKEREGFHGCQMPEQLLARIIRTCSNPNDVVLDPFAGSGTTLVVAKKLGRQPIGIELSPEYVRHIRGRLEQTRVGDPLDGFSDPNGTAPATKAGKTRGILHGSFYGLNGHKPKTAKQRQIEEDIQSGVVDAFRLTHDGYSTDCLLADPELNERFVDKCHELGVPGGPVVWNEALLRVRKSGKLPKLTNARRQLSFRDMDAYSYAAEVALHQVSVDYDVTLDEMLCDPELAGRFDRIAAMFSAEARSSFEYRWAALALRKRASETKENARDHLEWLEAALPPFLSLDAVETKEQVGPGVYSLLGQDEQDLYVGETYSFAERMKRIAAATSWKELELHAVRFIPAVEKELPGLKAILIQRLNPRLNSRLLFPQRDTYRSSAPHVPQRQH